MSDYYHYYYFRDYYNYGAFTMVPLSNRKNFEFVVILGSINYVLFHDKVKYRTASA